MEIATASLWTRHCSAEALTRFQRCRAGRRRMALKRVVVSRGVYATPM